MSIRYRGKDKHGKDVYDVEVWGTRRLDGTRPHHSKRVHGGIRTAQTLERQLLMARDAGKLASGTMTFKAWMDVYTADGEVSDATRAKWDYLGGVLTKYLGKRKLKEITPMLLRELKAELADTTLAGTTQRMVWDMLSQVLKQATVEQYIGFNPCDVLKPPKAGGKKRQALTHEQADKLLTSLSKANQYLELYAATLLATGARPGEVLSLTWSDLDLDAATVHLVATKTAHQTTAGDRVVPISAELAKRLKSHHAAQNETRLKMADKWQDAGLVFPVQQTNRGGGRPWTVRAMRQAWNSAGGDDVCTPYTLRHTRITWWRQSGMRAELVAYLAGHAKTSTTLDTYSHVHRSEVEEARAFV